MPNKKIISMLALLDSIGSEDGEDEDEEELDEDSRVWPFSAKKISSSAECFMLKTTIIY